MASSLRTYIRVARPDDREAVLRFSEHTWEWGDYISEVWEDWLRDRSGKLLVATVQRVPVAVAHVVIVAPGQAWLEGLRVDPDCRQRELATRLTERCMKEAPLLGARVIRFATSAANQPVHRIAAKLGFAMVTSLFPRQAEATPGSSAALGQAAPADAPRLLAFLRQSAVFKAMGGLYSSGWRFRTLNSAVLQESLNRGAVRIVGKPDAMRAVAITRAGEGLTIAYADGDSESLATMALGLRAEAAGCKRPKVTAWLPENTQIHQLFAQAGYEPFFDNPLWVYRMTV